MGFGGREWKKWRRPKGGGSELQAVLFFLDRNGKRETEEEVLSAGLMDFPVSRGLLLQGMIIVEGKDV